MEKQKLNPTLVYILSILGFLCCCIGLGFIFAGIAYFKAHSQLKKAKLNPENYENIKAMETAKIVALVALILNLLVVIRIIYVISTVGWDGLQDMYDQFIEGYNEARQG